MQKREGSIKGIKVAGSFNLTHLLFVDDVIFFGIGTLQEVKKYTEILDLCCKFIGMEVHIHKSSTFFNGLEENMERQIAQVISYTPTRLEKGIKYPGFHLNPNDYKFSDWKWFYKKIEDRFTNKCFRWLFRVLNLAASTVILQ
jgi:hypothetical protein